ncbi:uncharacterized protein LOC127708343 isoform X1 [Mytilus californianus]|uniref:uncharacterized protein LOC127708343 isoform X1 n=1 Tax=Mytilus californianus TaxID=6549 RepID=UPI0022468E91|nr:uncharacterized protein LOC127708343 isoform X1 [Mytilus californianus]
MIAVVYCLIIISIVFRYTKGDQLNLAVNDHTTTWKDAFGFCKDQTYWHQIFNDCQPETCTAYAVVDKIINKLNLGRQQYWINGYILRSPVIVNKGCYSLKVEQKEYFYSRNFSFLENSVYECSRSCVNHNTEYIFLKGKECLCIPRSKFMSALSIYTEENNDACSSSCRGHKEDKCGGVSSVYEEVYSAYEIVNKKSPPGMKPGNTCAAVYSDPTNENCRFNYTRCSSSLPYICEGYNKTKCYNEPVSWYTARQNCQEKSLKLTSTNKKRCPKKQHWIGTYVAERFKWGNDFLPSDALCLTLVIDGSDVRFDTEKCKSILYSLCYKKQHTTSKKENDSPYRSTSSAMKKSSAGLTTYRSAINTESDSNEDKTNIIVLIVAGSVGGVLVLVIVLIIVIVIKRRIKTERENMDVGVVQRQPDTNSKPIKNTIPEESRILVNVTEEGIYNHLGDSEKMIEMKQQDSSIYDVMGDDEYYVFSAGEKRQKFKDDDDLYDQGASSDVYNTTNDTVTTNRPESDTYNVK